MYFLPLQMIEKQRQKGHVSDEVLLKCYQVYSQEMVNLHMGQGLDICWHKNLGAGKSFFSSFIHSFIFFSFFLFPNKKIRNLLLMNIY